MTTEQTISESQHLWKPPETHNQAQVMTAWPVTLDLRSMSGLNQASLICVCGHSFTQSSSYTKHSKGCQAGRKWLSDVLAHAQETLQKKRRVQVSAAQSHPVPHDSGTDSDAISVQAHTGNFHSEDAQSTTINHIGHVVGTNGHVAVPSFSLQLLLHGKANSGTYSGCSKSRTPNSGQSGDFAGG